MASPSQCGMDAEQQVDLEPCLHEAFNPNPNLD